MEKVQKAKGSKKHKITSEQASDAVDKAGSVSGAAKLLGVHTDTVKLAMKRGEKAGRSHGGLAGGRLKGQGLSELKNQYDQDTIIRRVIKAGLRELGDSWLAEGAFVAGVEGLTPYKWGLYRDQFAGHVIEVPGKKRIIAGTVRFANKCRETLA
jgi:hypothetical protein